MKRRTIFPILAALVAAPFIGLPKLKARPIKRRKVWRGQRKYWLGSGDFNDPNCWEPYGVPQSPDTIVVAGGELTIPPGRKFKRLEVHSGIVRVDNDSCGNYCCVDELFVSGDGGIGDWDKFVVGDGCSAISIGE